MKLPVIIPDIRTQAWDCRGCTTCCRELVVHLSSEDRRRIDRQNWAARLGVAPYVRYAGGVVLNHAPEGGCVFLLPDGKCRIHAELGMDAKPLACRIYPFTLERESDSIRVGLRFDCPTVTRSEGRAVSAHRKEIQHTADAIAKELPALFRSEPESVEFARDLKIGRPALDRIIARLDRWIGDTRRPIHERIAGLHAIVATLNDAKLQRFDEARLSELIDMLADDLPVSVAERIVVPPPTAAQVKLLHQSAFAHAAFIRFEDSTMGLWKSIRFRFQQLKYAKVMLGGKGPIPPMGCDDLDATFEQIAAIRPIPPQDSGEAADLLTRYLQARITNHDGFGRAYYGWSVLAGMSTTLLAVAVAGWFARRSAAAAGRGVLTTDDVRAAVAIVDRSAGRSPELGAKSAKLRLRFLAQDNGLLRLLRQYAIVSDDA